jgi:hypothetical protein
MVGSVPHDEADDEPLMASLKAFPRTSTQPAPVTNSTVKSKEDILPPKQQTVTVSQPYRTLTVPRQPSPTLTVTRQPSPNLTVSRQPYTVPVTTRQPSHVPVTIRQPSMANARALPPPVQIAVIEKQQTTSQRQPSPTMDHTATLRPPNVRPETEASKKSSGELRGPPSTMPRNEFRITAGMSQVLAQLHSKQS